jgi:hypothetical protein
MAKVIQKNDVKLYLAQKKEKKKAKNREKNKMKKREKRRRERSKNSPLLDLCYYQGPQSIHTSCVYDLALVIA